MKPLSVRPLKGYPLAGDDGPRLDHRVLITNPAPVYITAFCSRSHRFALCKRHRFLDFRIERFYITQIDYL